MKNMETMRRALRLPAIPLEGIKCLDNEPPSPDSGFSSDDSTSSFPTISPRQKSDRLRSALRRLPSDCRKKVRFGGATVVQLDPEEDDEPPPPSFSPTPKAGVTLPNFSFRTESEYWQRARDNGVCVSAIRQCGPSTLLVQMAVHNRAFDKEVFVRWTTDDWGKSSDQMAVYSHAATADIDIFTASLPIKEEKTEFCICYKVNNSEHWDNNDGKNFRIQFRL